MSGIKKHKSMCDNKIAKLTLLFLLAAHLIGITQASCGTQDLMNNSSWLMPYLLQCEDEETGSGSGELISSFDLSDCPEPDCVSITMTNQQTLTVDFGLRCLLVDCQYNYTVEFFTPNDDILLASDSRTLTEFEVNQTQFQLSASLLRDEAESFEMGVVVVVAVFLVDANGTKGQYIINGDFSPSILDLTVINVTNTSITLTWDLPFPTVTPDMYRIYYNYTELSGTVPRTGVDTINVTNANNTYTITDLLPYTEYDVSVATVYDDVFSNDVTISAETMEGVSTPVTNLTVEVDLEMIMFNIAWNEPQFPAGVIESYNLSFSSEQEYTTFMVSSFLLEMSISFDFFVNYTVTVIAVNEFGLGEANTVIMASPQGAPTSPQNFIVQQVDGSSTSLNVSWTEPLTFNGILTNYSVYCRVSNVQFYPEQETEDGYFINSATPETLSLTITELLPFTSYDCYVTASTIGGESEPSNNESARTDEDVPTVPENFTDIELTATSVTLEWNRPTTPNGEIIEYLLEYTNSSLDEALMINIPVVYNRAMDEYNVTDITVNYLNEFTMYTFNISAITGGGSGPKATVDFTTSEAAPSAIPLNVIGVNLSSTSLLISWEPPPESDRNGNILGYNITYFTINDSDLMTNITTSDTMTNITGLLVYTEYNVSVAAYTSVGSGPFDTVTVRTDSSVPEVPQNLMYRNLTSTSVEISWEPPSTFNGPNEGYNVTYNRIETNERKTVNVLSTSLNITALEIYEEYSVEVVALSDKGAGEATEILVLTDEDLPGIIEGFEADEINSSAIFVQWETPVEPNGIITQYEVEYTLSDTSTSEAVVVSPEFLSTELMDLEFYTEYAIRVRAYTSVGPGNYTNVIVVRTDPAPATPPTNVAVTPSERTILLTWMEPESPRGDIVGYYISTNATLPNNFEQATLEDNITVLNVSVDVLDITFTGLTPFTYYEFSVAAYSFNLMDSSSNFSILTGEFSDNQVIQTLQDLPGIVSDFAADELNLSTIAVEWSSPLEPNGIITVYEVEYILATNNNVSTVNFTADSLTGPVFSIELTNLEFHTEYDIRVRAYTSVGPGNYTNVIRIRTDPAPATPPTNVAVTSTETTIMLTWMEPESPRGVIVGYYISTNATLPDNFDQAILEDNNIVLNVSVDVLDITFTGLTPFTYYEFSVAAYSFNLMDSSSNFSILTGEFSDNQVIQTLQDSPTSPQNFIVQQVDGSSTSLNASWTEPLTFNGILTNYSVYCRVSNEQFYPEQETEDGYFINSATPETLSLTITELLPFTSYDCYVTASTIGGESEPSTNESARTDEDVPTVPENFTDIELTATSVTLEWNRPTTPNGEIIEYLLEYTNSSLDEALMINIPVVYNRAMNEYNVTNITVNYLNEFTMYTFNISAITGGGSGPKATVDFTTSEAAPSAIPLNVIGVNLSSTSLLISWEPPPESDRNGNILGYNITYFTINDSDLMTNITTSDTMTNITGLLVYTEYNVSVAAYTSVGSGPFDTVTVRTDSSVPEVPQNLMYRNLTSTSVEISWEPPSTFNGPNEGYNVTYNRIETNERKTVNVLSTSLNITALEIYEEYSVEVVALSDKGAGEATEILVLTDEDLPGIIEGFEADEINSSAIFVQWETPVEPNGIITQYEVEYTLSDTPTSEAVVVSPEFLSTELMDLEFYTEYDIRVRAYTSVGPGNYTNVIRIRTDPAPATPPTNVAVMPSERTILLSWMEPESPRGDIVGYYISTNATLPNNFEQATLEDDITVLNVSVDVLDITFTGLTPFTYYEFSVAAYSFNLMDSSSNFSILTGEFSDNQVIQTLEDLPGIVSDFAADELNLSTIAVEWSSPLKPNGIITVYEVEYILATNNNVSTVNFTADSLTGPVFSIELTNLEFHTEYDIRVRAYTSVGPGNYTNVIRIRTDPAPATPPTNVAVTSTETTIMLTWMEPERPRGVIVGYYISTNATLPNNFDQATLEDNITVLNVSVDLLNITFTGLTPFTYYEFSVAAYSFNLMDSSSNFSILTGEFSDNQVIQTLQDSPTSPRNFIVQQVDGSSTSLNASWTEPLTFNGILTNYSVYCRVSNVQFYPEQETEDGYFINSATPETLSLTITELLPFTSYDCYVTASTIGGESEPSNNESARTDEDIPTVPENFTDIELTATSVTLKWNRPTTPNGEIIEYLLEYTNSSLDEALMINIPVVYNRAMDEYNVTDITVNYLNEFTMYTFNISAITGGGSGPKATVDFTTSEAAPSAIPLNVIGVNSSSTSLSISWKPPPESDRNGNILGYNITYFTINDSDLMTNITTSDTMTNITGLLVYTEYNVSVAAYTSVGSGPFDTVTVRTDSAPPFAPENLSITVLNSTALSVTWSEPSIIRGIRDGYRLQYQLETQDLFLMTNYTPIDLGVDSFSIVLSDLHEFAEYVIVVQVMNDKGLGDEATMNEMTFQSVPGGGVRDVLVVVINSTAVNVSWLPPARSLWNGVITNYAVYYESVDDNIAEGLMGFVVLRNFTNGDDPRQAPDPLERESVITSQLEEFINYNFTVTISTSIGPNAPGDTPSDVQITTNEAAPIASPINITIVVLSALEAIITWSPPPYIDRNGEIVLYTISIMDSLGVFIDPINVTGTSFTAVDLPQYALFRVSVSASTSQGQGPFSSPMSAMTFEGLPSPVREVTLTLINQTSITVQWEEPNLPNGIIQGYYVFYYGGKANGAVFEGLNENVTLVVNDNRTTSLQLTRLLADTTYNFNVTAFTAAGNGSTGIGGSLYIPTGDPPTIATDSNFTIDLPTDETGDSLVTETTIHIEFVIPPGLNVNGPILRVQIILAVFGSTTDILSNYYFSSRASFPDIPPYFTLEVDIAQQRRRGLVKRQANGEEVVSETIGSQMNCGVEDEICNGPLREGTEYQFKFRAYNSDDDDSYAESAYSAPISTAAAPSSNTNTIVIAVVVVLILVIVIVGVVILLIVLYVKCKKRRKLYSFKGNGNAEALLHRDKSSIILTKSKQINTGPTIVPLSENTVIASKSTTRGTSVKATPHSRKVYMRDLPGFVTEMVSDSGFKFSEEYEKVSLIGLEHSKDASLMPENRAKNRYTNILAYDHSRVKLDYVDDEPGSDYINANYIPGYRVRRAYIATQGPLPSTFDDFWMLVWEQNVHNIVMLTQLVERGRTKCHRYWPGSQPEVYGDIAIEMSSEKELNDWIIRTFQLTKEKRTRTVYHFQFVSWPDHGVPEGATAALDFVQCVHENIQPMHGPVIVHCSAGVGRTGTFIALGTLLQHIRDHDWVDIFGLSCEMRQHRNHMIQTEAQYVFIHKAMVEICESLSTFSGSKSMQGFNPIYVNVGASSSPGVSQQSDTYMFGNSLMSEETSQFSKAYDESKF